MDKETSYTGEEARYCSFPAAIVATLNTKIWAGNSAEASRSWALEISDVEVI